MIYQLPKYHRALSAAVVSRLRCRHFYPGFQYCLGVAESVPFIRWHGAHRLSSLKIFCHFYLARRVKYILSTLEDYFIPCPSLSVFRHMMSRVVAALGVEEITATAVESTANNPLSLLDSFWHSLHTTHAAPGGNAHKRRKLEDTVSSPAFTDRHAQVCIADLTIVVVCSFQFNVPLTNTEIASSLSKISYTRVSPSAPVVTRMRNRKLS